MTQWAEGPPTKAIDNNLVIDLSRCQASLVRHLLKMTAALNAPHSSTLRIMENNTVLAQCRQLVEAV